MESMYDKLVAVIDEDGNEALYLNGRKTSFNGMHIYAIDIATAIGSTQTQAKLIEFQQLNVIPPESMNTFPARLKDLMKYVTPSK